MGLYFPLDKLRYISYVISGALIYVYVIWAPGYVQLFMNTVKQSKINKLTIES